MSLTIAAANLAESILDRPTVARDQILRATSGDGLTFEKNAAWRWRRPFTVRAHMNYFVAEDDAHRLWFRSSEFQDGRWRAVLFSHGQRVDCSELGVLHARAPVWCAGRLFAIVTWPDGRDGPAVASSTNGTLASFRPLIWPGIERHDAIDDLFVCDIAGGYAGWASCGRTTRAIYGWSSDDGDNWRDAGVAVTPQGEEKIVNNPSVVRLESGYRMYYRASVNPAVGSVIVSARSEDGIRWMREAGVRIRPGGQWDTHGVGFPFATRDSEGWVLYYTGFWGACAAGHRAASGWAGRVKANFE